MRSTAKLLGIGPNTFNARLRAAGILFNGSRVNISMQQHVNDGHFVMRPVLKEGESKHFPQCRVTTKGLDWLAAKLEKAGF